MREMKNSSISSFESVPSTWETIKLKAILSMRSEKNSGDRELLSVYLDRGVISYSESTGMQVHKPSQDLSNYQNVYQGDFVLNNQQAWRGSVGVSKYDGIISPAYFVYKMSDRCFPPYMNYLLRDSCMYQQYETASRGVGTIQRNIYAPWLMNCMIVLPPYSEQQSIAAYLDRKCAEIDTLTADIETQIETLEQYKRSVITEAVTKGLNPDVEMKDSGIEWVGMIPNDWDTTRIKYLYEIKSGATPSPNEENWDGDVVWITPADYKTKDKYIQCGKRNLSDIGYQSCSTTTVPIGSIVFSKRAPIGTVALAATELCTNQGCLSCIPKKNNNWNVYFYYVMSIGTEHFELLGRGTTFKEISANSFGDCKLPLPALSEQHAIAEYLDQKCSEMDSIIADKQTQLDTLAEYKKSLIYEYVTGKKEVPT